MIVFKLSINILDEVGETETSLKSLTIKNKTLLIKVSTQKQQMSVKHLFLLQDILNINMSVVSQK